MKRHFVSAPRSVMAVLGIATALGLPLLLMAADDLSASTIQPKRATFAITNVLTVKVPEGAQQVRIWFAVPQDDAESEVSNFTTEAAYPIRYTKTRRGTTSAIWRCRHPGNSTLLFAKPSP
jgi:hypothetical protein